MSKQINSKVIMWILKNRCPFCHKCLEGQVDSACYARNESESIKCIDKENGRHLLKQKEIVQQRLSYHFGRVGGGWIVGDMPFMNEFLNEVKKLCEMIKDKGEEK